MANKQKWKYSRISFRLIPVTGKDELDKLVCSQHMGLHSSVGTAMQRISVDEALKSFFTVNT